MFSRVLMSRRVAFVLAASAIVLGTATFGLMTGTSTGTGTPDPAKLEAFLIADLVILLLLALVIVLRITRMWAQRRQGMAGSALHMRLVVMFSALAVTPAILVTVFAALFLNFGFNSWFSDRVKTAVDASQAVASAYFEEHIQSIGADVMSMAADLNRDQALLSANPNLLNLALSNYAKEHNLTEASVISRFGDVLARGETELPTIGVGRIPPNAIDRANRGELVVLTATDADQVRALMRLEAYSSAYLMVGRFIDAQVLTNMDRVRQAAQTYLRMEESGGKIQITFVAIFAMVSLLLLFAAVWIGMALANQMVRPISRLIAASAQISSGNLSKRVEVDDTIGELGSLTSAFNAMTSRLEQQQQGLMQMNRTLDERRRFTETVLSGVSAGVIGLDGDGRIDLPNRSASQLLDTDLQAACGQDLADIIPEMENALSAVKKSPNHAQHDEIIISREGQPDRVLNLTMAAELLEGDVIGFVATFDDMTELQSAQRKAAWAGMARRIAHEIKNPLTPIQLAAERLKRKYLKQIHEDPDTFTTCTDTIVRQVDDLRRMVDEFSSFARMPQAVLRPENLSELCRQTVFLERNRVEGLSIETDLPAQDVTVSCDAQQITRVLTNVLKNASEAVSESGMDQDGWIRVSLSQQNVRKGVRTSILVEDNGPGLPETDLVRLTEPYVTTRDQGTGLGLAIVKKIMSEHGGDLNLENRLEGGARAVLTFPPQDAQSSPERPGQSEELLVK
ncbi:PAS domain-containing sensor histidine kinase [Magnetovibrio sp. PR-2]|uniref:sensor histidine kinase NtrY-like n=1 Tax=Magnetovibrio sp. PR-2 TaxID=3120356 RepID=UPI002FCE1F65